jgi:hypothetical protein
MNCRQFEDLMTDLARENALEEAVRSQALAHAGCCSRCSELLANQRALSAAIKLSIADGGEAPAHLEKAIISAYRLRRAKTPRGIASLQVPRARRVSYWGIAAAVLVALLGVAALRLLRTSPPVATRVARPTPDLPEQKNSPPAVMEATPEHMVSMSAAAPVASKSEPAVKRAGPKQPAAKAPPADAEIATDFFALTSGPEVAAMESGQLVRVLLPRNAMAAYGLPVNQERIDQPVTAQVLIGQDGVARAIRFLSTQHSNYVQTGMRSKR